MKNSFIKKLCSASFVSLVRSSRRQRIPANIPQCLLLCQPSIDTIRHFAQSNSYRLIILIEKWELRLLCRWFIKLKDWNVTLCGRKYSWTLVADTLWWRHFNICFIFHIEKVTFFIKEKKTEFYSPNKMKKNVSRVFSGKISHHILFFIIFFFAQLQFRMSQYHHHRHQQLIWEFQSWLLWFFECSFLRRTFTGISHFTYAKIFFLISERKLLIFMNFSCSTNFTRSRGRRNKCFHWQKFHLMGTFLSVYATCQRKRSEMTQKYEFTANDVRFIQLMLSVFVTN